MQMTHGLIDFAKGRRRSLVSLLLGLVLFTQVSCSTLEESYAAGESRKKSVKQDLLEAKNREIYLKGGETGILIIHGYKASSLTFSPIAHALNQRGQSGRTFMKP